jgi:hypothetical protein
MRPNSRSKGSRTIGRKQHKKLRSIRMANYRNELEARERFLVRHPTWTRQQLLNAINRSGIAGDKLIERWVRSGKVLRVKHHRREAFPQFQFERGRRRPIFKQLIRLMRNDRSDWSIAHWLVDSNGWLDGDRPLELLLTEVELVLDAAQQEILPSIG